MLAVESRSRSRDGQELVRGKPPRYSRLILEAALSYSRPQFPEYEPLPRAISSATRSADGGELIQAMDDEDEALNPDNVPLDSISMDGNRLDRLEIQQSRMSPVVHTLASKSEVLLDSNDSGADVKKFEDSARMMSTEDFAQKKKALMASKPLEESDDSGSASNIRPASTAIVLARIPLDTTEKDLMAIMEDLSLPVPYELYLQKYSSQTNGFHTVAYAYFDSTEQAGTVLQALNGLTIGSKTLRLRYKKGDAKIVGT